MDAPSAFLGPNPGQLYHRKCPSKISNSAEKKHFVRFEVITAVTMKNAVFLNIKPSWYLTGDTLDLRYRVQPVNAM
jgi:hypothetical protein